jgi:hypothetical protein
MYTLFELMLASYGILLVEGLCYKLGYKIFKLEVSNYLGTIYFFGAIFCNLATKKRLVNSIERFLKFEKKKSPYLDQKNLKVVKFR